MRRIGMDVHRDFCEVAIVEGGQVRSAGRIATSPEALELLAHSLCADDEVVLETTSGGARDRAGCCARMWPASCWPTPPTCARSPTPA